MSDYTPGMFYDVGSAVALFWPNQHPELKEPAEQRWIVFDSWGGLEVITGRLPREDGVGREIGMVPFLAPPVHTWITSSGRTVTCSCDIGQDHPERVVPRGTEIRNTFNTDEIK